MDDTRWNRIGFDAGQVAVTTAKAVLHNRFASGKHKPSLPAKAKKSKAFEMSVLLTGDTGMQAMNRDYRGKDKPTNVLSFASLDDPGLPIPDGPVHLGDLALGLETLQREAAEQEKPLKAHFTHLVVHGTLHLLGYDHMDNGEAEIMESIEIDILNEFGIENPYKNPDFVPD